MAALRFKDLLVVIPHSGVLVPHEISLDILSEDFSRLMRNVDWYTNWLYDFRDILGNSQTIFPYCNLILEANRHPDRIAESVPLRDVLAEPVFKRGFEPDSGLRAALSKRYLQKFHKGIKEHIAQGALFMLDSHSTISAKGMVDNQIELMNYQVNARTGRKTFFCPDIFIEAYAAALMKLLPGIRVTVNESRYDQVYGHVCAEHSINSAAPARNRVPAILQETNQKLYMNADGTPDYIALETLRRAFASALLHMKKKVFV